MIPWVRGDKPLPLHVDMDLSAPGLSVQVFLRDIDDPDAGVLQLAPTVTNAANGDLTAVGAALDAAARYLIETKVYKGVELVATFPNAPIREILVVRPDATGSGTIPEGVTILDGGAP